MSLAAKQSSLELFEDACKNSFFAQSQEKVQRRLYELVLIFKGAGEEFSHKEKDHVLKTLCRFVAKGKKYRLLRGSRTKNYSLDTVNQKVKHIMHELFVY